MGEINIVTPANLPQEIKEILSYLADVMFNVAYGQDLDDEMQAVVDAVKIGVEAEKAAEAE